MIIGVNSDIISVIFSVHLKKRVKKQHNKYFILN